MRKRKKYSGVRWRGGDSYEINYYVDGKRKTETIQASSEKEAFDLKIQRMVEHKQKPRYATTFEERKIPFDWAFNYYREQNEKLLDSNTLQRSECIYKQLIAFLKSQYADVQLITEITPSLGKRYKEYLQSKGRTPSGINTDISKLRAIFSCFCEYEFIKDNPFKKVDKFPRRLARPQKKHLPTDVEVRTILQGVSDRRQYEDITRFLLRVGRRIEEASLYEKADIVKDLTGKPVAIKVRAEITKTKEDGEIPLDDELAQIIANALQKSPRSPYIFINPYGMKVAQNTYREFLKNLCQGAGITVITPHCFRYYVVNKFLNAGINFKDAMAITGHMDVQSFMSYVKSTAEGRQRALAITRIGFGDQLFFTGLGI